MRISHAKTPARRARPPEVLKPAARTLIWRWLMGLLLVPVLAGRAGPLPPNLTYGLVESLTFDGDLHDGSGKGSDGASQSPVYDADRFGTTNSALYFPADGSVTATVPDSPEFHQSEITIACWFKSPLAYQYNEIAYKLFPNNNRPQWSLYVIGPPSPAALSFAFANAGQLRSMLSKIYIADTSRWHMVAATISATNAILYLDGGEIENTALGSPHGLDDGPAGAPIVLGPSSFAGPYSGDLDDFKLYNRALSADEIRQLYRLGRIADYSGRGSAVARIDEGFLVEIAVTNGGVGYSEAPLVQISGGGGTGATAVSAITTNGTVQSIKVTDAGSGYTTAPAVWIAAPKPGPAAAIAQLADGRVQAIRVTEPGAGYTSPPHVSIYEGGGAGTVAVAHLVGGSVASIVVLHPGGGFTNTPAVLIEPPGLPIDENVSLRIRPASVAATLHLTAHRSYVLEESFDFVYWFQVGDPFLSLKDVMEQDVPIDQSPAYFRLRDVTDEP